MKPSKVLSPSREELQSLIASAGGPEALISLVMAFYEAMEKDTMIGFFFTGRDLAAIAEKQAGFILLAAGMSRKFDGKGPATAHGALPPILPGHFDRRIAILKNTLRAQGLSSESIELWVRFEESFRTQVVSN